MFLKKYHNFSSFFFFFCDVVIKSRYFSKIPHETSLCVNKIMVVRKSFIIIDIYYYYFVGLYRKHPWNTDSSRVPIVLNLLLFRCGICCTRSFYLDLPNLYIMICDSCYCLVHITWYVVGRIMYFSIGYQFINNMYCVIHIFKFLCRRKLLKNITL